MRKLLICTPRYILSISIYSIFLSDYIFGTIQDIKFKFSAVLSIVKATQCVKLQSAGSTGFKVGIFRISPITIEGRKVHNSVLLFYL